MQANKGVEIVGQPFGKSPLFASSQFISFASAAYRAAQQDETKQQIAESDDSSCNMVVEGGAGVTSSTCCYAGMLPLWIVVECIGKKWVMAVERVVAVQPDGPNLPLDTEGIMFSISYTLGIVQRPVFVELYFTVIGWISPDRTVERYIGDDGTIIFVEDQHTGEVVMGPVELEAEAQESQLYACNTKWIVLTQSPDLLMVWKVVDGKVVSDCVTCSWLDYEFIDYLGFMPISEYNFESDILEVFYWKCGGGADIYYGEEVGGLIDLNTVWNKHAIRTTKVFRCNLEHAWIQRNELKVNPRPLVDRAERKYYVLCRSEGILDLSTGRVMRNSYGTELKVVDESHIAAISRDLSSTAVVSLSSFLAAYAITPSDEFCYSSPKRSLVEPCITHQHTPGTVFVTAGWGLVLSVIHSESSPDTRLVTVKDALSGTALFTMSIPRSERSERLLTLFPVRFRSPRLYGFSTDRKMKDNMKAFSCVIQ